MPVLRPILCTLLLAGTALAAPPEGYYRFPALHGDTIVFTAEGDLWTVPTEGGVARRLTSHQGEEAYAAVSPDGQTVAFSATYEGPREVYTMPLPGGLPTRRSWEAEPSTVVGWTSGGELLYSTTHFSTLPDPRLVRLDLTRHERRQVPLTPASDGAFDASDRTVFFTRPAYHRNNTKRYQGGTARDIWRFRQGDEEAVNLTGDFPGEDHAPMFWRGRVYYLTDRDGTMNIWSIDQGGGEPRQHTYHAGWDAKSPSLDDGRVVYQLGADLWLLDLASGQTAKVDITLASDFDQLREKWVRDPLQHLTAFDFHPEGKSVLLTARGRVFAWPVGSGRRIRLARQPGVRYRDAAFMPDGRVMLWSDASGELELYLTAGDGTAPLRQLTQDGEVLRFGGEPSPDGRWIAYTDHNQDLWVLQVDSGESRRINDLREGIGGLAWSPDSRWLAYGRTAENTYQQIYLYGLEDGHQSALTSDRVNSLSPAWSPDGQWLYFLSDRHLHSLVAGPWGPRQPEAFFDRPMGIYQLALGAGQRPTFRPPDELTPELQEPEEDGKKRRRPEPPERLGIDLAGLAERLYEVPVAPGNYRRLQVTHKGLLWLATESGPDAPSHLMALEAKAEAEPKTLAEDVMDYALAARADKLLLRRRGGFSVLELDGNGGGRGRQPERGNKERGNKERGNKGEEKAIDLAGWSFPISMREDFRQIFIDAWRLERDYFYDPGMHGLDWLAVRDKYLPLVDRITTRAELSDLIGDLVSELSALHVSVRGGDHRSGPDDVPVATLGARLERHPDGYRVAYIYRSDPDYPQWRSPLADPFAAVQEGDLLLAINGVPLTTVDDPGVLLRDQGGRQVRLQLRSADGGEERDVIVIPTDSERMLRYQDWRHGRRLRVEELGGGEIGYVHLTAMGRRNLAEWYRNFYPVFNRRGLIIDVRHNPGGNIDSLILEKLLRRAWFYWKGRVGQPTWNMQYAFRGHMVVLCDERTGSDGEAFSEGFRRLGLGPVIGRRTWGGEIWLSDVNRLSDGGIARAPQFGVYGPEREWLIEGWGVEPDIVVDNPPHATWKGGDAQLEAAVAYLKEQIAKDPRDVPTPPPYPDKSFDYSADEDL